MVEGTPVTFQTTEENHFKATVEQLEAARTDKTKVVLLNSPSNPTGMIYSKAELEAIGNWAVWSIMATPLRQFLAYQRRFASKPL